MNVYRSYEMLLINTGRADIVIMLILQIYSNTNIWIKYNDIKSLKCSFQGGGQS